MSFRLSSGTLDVLAGVYAPPQKHRPGSGGGRAKGAKAGGSLIALMLPKSGAAQTGFRPSPQIKHAFRSSSHERVSDRAIMTMERTARGVPEVVVRITGRQHGSGHVLANFSYISRLGHGEGEELALHTSDGEVLRDGRDMQILAQDWHEWEMGGGARRQGATSISMILSMPTGTDPERLQEAALDFARTEFANRSWVASLHVDRDHPHVHLTFARRDLDGRRFHPDRDDLFRYRQRFAEKLRDRGIEANATPARARGIDPVHEPIAARKVREKGDVPRLDKSRAARAERLREQGIPDPVKAVLAGQQAAVRSAHIRSFAMLSTSPLVADQMIAQSLEGFVAAMPAPEPNSTKTIRLVRETRAEVAPMQPVRSAVGILDASTQRVETGLDRIRRLHERLTASDEPSKPSSRALGKPAAGQHIGTADRLRALLNEKITPVTPPQTPADETPATPRPEGPGSMADRLRAQFDEGGAPSKTPDPAKAGEISRPDRLPESTNRLDLAGAIQRYAQVVVGIAGMKQKGLPVPPHQSVALTQASEALDTVRNDALRHFVTAIERNPDLVHDAAAGDLRGSLEAMEVEAQVDRNPQLRAERFLERWWNVENERSLGDPMVGILRGHMVDDLYNDPALREKLERCAPELGLARIEHQSPEQMLQQWRMEMDQARDRQRDRGGPGR